MTPSITAAIVDDDARLREGLRLLLSTYCPDVDIVAEAGTVAEAIHQIMVHRPDVVLLDVDLGDGTGMDVLSALEGIAVRTIFVTAHQQYAVEAFRHAAYHYLVKPVLPEDLVRAVERIKADVRRDRERLQGRSSRLVLRNVDMVHIVERDSILYCVARGVYTEFHLVEGGPILLSRNLKEYEELLGERFLRVHHSYVVNVDHVRRFDKRGGGHLVLSNGTTIGVAVRRRDEVLRLLADMARP